MKIKKFSLVVLPLLAAAVVYGGTVVYTKNQDGTVTKSEILVTVEADNKVDQLRAEIVDLNKKIDYYNAQVLELQAQLAARVRELSDLTSVK